MNLSHDSIAHVYDAYLAGINWVSSDAGSNFMIQKGGDKFRMAVNSGTAAGSTFTWDYFWEANTSGSVTKPLQPYFNAYQNANLINVIGGAVGWYTIPFNTERIDRVGNYNPSTGVFTATVSGLHSFSYEYYLINMDATNTDGLCELLTSNKAYYGIRGNVWVKKTASGAYAQTSSFYVDMDAGDTAEVRLNCTGNLFDIFGSNTTTWFTGGLIC
jgi:hypothetical protein